MKRALFMIAVACLIVVPTKMVAAHCEVPCGIYGDQRRFEEMLEDCETIAKALGEIQKLAGKDDPQSVNQCVRWVTTKEAHAVNTQHVIAQYFLSATNQVGQPKVRRSTESSSRSDRRGHEVQTNGGFGGSRDVEEVDSRFVSGLRR